MQDAFQAVLGLISCAGVTHTTVINLVFWRCHSHKDRIRSMTNITSEREKVRKRLIEILDQTQALVNTSPNTEHWIHRRGEDVSLLNQPRLEASANSSCLSLSHS